MTRSAAIVASWILAGAAGLVPVSNRLPLLASANAADLPNLTPHQLSAWSDRIVVSTTTGTNTDSEVLTASDNLYVDWAVLNNGNVETTTEFHTELYVDGVMRTWWFTRTPLYPTSTVSITDYAVGTLPAGQHTITIKTDGTAAVAESNESDNAYTKTITVIGPPAGVPNLTPYRPLNWSDRIVVSTATGTNTDADTLTATDSLYVDWAVLNNGDVATGARYYTGLYVDGVLRYSWFSDPPVNANSYRWVQDYSLGSLFGGTHTITLKTDTTSVIVEGDEQDNEYTKTITITGGAPNLKPYQPAGWSDKLVVSTVAGTNTDSAVFGPTDTLYIDWAVINDGNAMTTGNFFTELWVDGLVPKAWLVGPVTPGYFASIQDYALGPLASGTHTIRIVHDNVTVDLVAESNELDNEYARMITIEGTPPSATPSTTRTGTRSATPVGTATRSSTPRSTATATRPAPGTSTRTVTFTRTTTATSTRTLTRTPIRTATPTPSASGTPTGPCFGDCDQNGRVSVAELVTGVDIALRKQAVVNCAAFDANRDQRVTVDELAKAVRAALGGCAGAVP